jgi:hypothetical protein
MPNWCENEVKISGSTIQISKLMSLVKDDGFFQNVLPMPEELKGFQSPVRIITQEEFDEQEVKYQEWLAKSDEEKRKEHPFGFSKGMTKEISAELQEKFGHNNWYDWCVRNWGTKWDVIDVAKEYVYGEQYGELRFLTAWSPPEGVKMKIDEMFPDLDISWFYKEEGEGFAGWL